MNDIFKFQKLSAAIWLLTSLFYSLQMTMRFLPGMMMDHMTLNLQMSAEEIGFLAGFYYIGYSIVQIPIGVMLDKYHPRFVISFFIIVSALGVVITAYGTTKYHMYIARFLIGLGSSIGILGAVKAIDDFFPAKYSALMGITVLMGVLGSFYGGLPISKSFEKIGLESTLLIIINAAIFLASLILLLYRKSRSETGDVGKLDFFYILKLSLSDKKIWMIGIFAGLMIGPLGGFADMWAVKYLSQAKGISGDYSKLGTSIVFFGLGIGSAFIGYAANKFSSYSKLIGLMGFMQIIVLLLLFSIHTNNVIYIFILMFLIGFLSSYQIVVFALANKISSKNMVSVVTSVVNSIVMSFGFFFNFAVGSILKIFFESVRSDILIYSEKAYHTSFSIILICIVAGVAGFMLLLKKIERGEY